MFETNLKNLLGTQKKNRKKIDEKMMFFFVFEVPTDKNIFAARFLFFNFLSFFFFSALNSIPLIKAPGSGSAFRPVTYR